MAPISTHDESLSTFGTATTTTTITSTATTMTSDPTTHARVSGPSYFFGKTCSSQAKPVKERRAESCSVSFPPGRCPTAVKKHRCPSSDDSYASALATDGRRNGYFLTPFSHAKYNAQSFTKGKNWCSSSPTTANKKKKSVSSSFWVCPVLVRPAHPGAPSVSALDRKSSPDRQSDTPTAQQNTRANVPKIYDFENPTNSPEELKLFPWEIYHGRTVECEVCQCLVSLVYEQLGKKFVLSTNQKSAPEFSEADAKRRAGAEAERPASKAKSKAQAAIPAKTEEEFSRAEATAAEAARDLPAVNSAAERLPAQAAANSATRSGKTVAVELRTPADATAATKNSPKGSPLTAAGGELTTERPRSPSKDKEDATAPTAAAPAVAASAISETYKKTTAVENTPHVSDLLSKKQRLAWTVAVSEIIDSVQLCTFGHWKFYADKTEDMHVYEMTAACKRLLAEGGDEAFEKSILNSNGDSRAAARSFCLHTHCTALWPDHDHPYNRETQSDRNTRFAKQFLEWNRGQLGIRETATGLQYRLDGDIVHMHYLAKTLDGKTFENTFRQGRATVVRFAHLVPGWKEALQMMNKGDEMHIYIPPHLGFGQTGLGTKVKPNELVMLHLRLEYVESSASSSSLPAAPASASPAAARGRSADGTRTDSATAAAARRAVRQGEL